MISEKIEVRLKETTAAKVEAEVRERKAAVAGMTGASQLGWVNDCTRHLCLLRLCPDKAAREDEKLTSRFQEGKKQEALMAADLEEAGIKLLHHDRMVWPAMQLTGEIDRMVVINGGEYPLDFKTCSSAMFQKIKKVQSKDDLIKSPFIWLRHYPAQLQAYMLMLRKSMSVLFFKDKESGQRRFLDVELDYNYASGLIEGLKYVNECVRKEDPPAAAKIEACDTCPFADYDFPEREDQAAEGVEIITEETWLMKLKEYQSLVDAGVDKAAKELEKLDKEIKEEFRGRRALVGAHLVESKRYEVSFADVPQEIKSKYMKQREQFRTIIKMVAEKL